jgi:hypothetical protein
VSAFPRGFFTRTREGSPRSHSRDLWPPAGRFDLRISCPLRQSAIHHFKRRSCGTARTGTFPRAWLGLSFIGFQRLSAPNAGELPSPIQGRKGSMSWHTSSLGPEVRDIQVILAELDTDCH